MQKRSITFGDYDTAAHGWTLTGWTLGDPEQKTNYVEKTGGDGSWDLSTVLTEGLPRYKDRPLTVTLECSKDRREDREKLISELVNKLDGLVWDVVLPDHPGHFLRGRLHVAVNQNSYAYAAVTITGTCEPWLYFARETLVEMEATEEEQTMLLYNTGRRAVVPVIKVVEGSIKLTFSGASVDLQEGSYEWAHLLLTPGYHTLTYTGNGTTSLTYREAVLR